MGTTLTGTTPANTYDSLIKVTDNGPLSGTLKTLTDGLGNDSALALSTSAIKVTGSISGTNGFNGFAGATHNLLVDWSASSQFTTLTATDIFFGTNANERMRITAAGNVGIGTTLPSAALDVNGAILTRLGSGGVSLSGNSSPDLGYIGYNYHNVSGTETVTQNVRNSWRIQFGNGSNKNLNIGYRAPSAAASAFTERLSIDSSGNVGIGTSAPDSNLHIKNTSSNAKLTIETADAYDAYINFSAASGEWSMGYDRTSDDLIFCAGDNLTTNERIRFTSDGLTFNGDTAAANALDDYEEGTFTATLVPSTSGSISLFSTFQTLSYTKIGRQVSVKGLLLIQSVSSPVGTEVKIQGLPFVTANAGSGRGSGSVFVVGNSFNSSVYHGQNVSEISVIYDASTVSQFVNSDWYVTFTYFV